jgi:hypothetical protein
VAADGSSCRSGIDVAAAGDAAFSKNDELGAIL